jgi:tetratricopeptide (TPR) repeat protein
MTDGRWQAVERFVVALRSNPNAAALHAALGFQQLALGRADDAAASYARAAALDPRSPAWPAELANAHDNRRAFDEAVRVRERQLALDPRSPAAYVAQALSLVNAGGDTAAARRVLARGEANVERGRIAQILGSGSGAARGAARLAPARSTDAAGARHADRRRGRAAPLAAPPPHGAPLRALGASADARRHADSSRLAALDALRTQPDEPELHETLAVAYATLGTAGGRVARGAPRRGPRHGRRERPALDELHPGMGGRAGRRPRRRARRARGRPPRHAAERVDVLAAAGPVVGPAPRRPALPPAAARPPLIGFADPVR